MRAQCTRDTRASSAKLTCMFSTFPSQAESDMLDVISTYQQCQDLKADTSLDDLEIKDLEEFEDSLETWDCVDGHVNGHTQNSLS